MVELTCLPDVRQLYYNARIRISYTIADTVERDGRCGNIAGIKNLMKWTDVFRWK